MQPEFCLVSKNMLLTISFNFLFLWYLEYRDLDILKALSQKSEAKVASCTG